MAKKTKPKAQNLTLSLNHKKKKGNEEKEHNQSANIQRYMLLDKYTAAVAMKKEEKRRY